MVNKNMLRDLSNKLPEITEEMWGRVLHEHRSLVDEFLEVNAQLSPQTRQQYRSALRQWFYFVHSHLNDKPLHTITKRDFLKYMSYLQSRNMSSSALAFKKAAVSSLNNYIENVVSEDDEKYERFRNFTKNLPQIAKNQVYQKVKITREEYQYMLDVLLAQDNYLGAAWVATAFNSGARRAELIQLKTEILEYSIPEGQNYLLSHVVRGKGKSVDGKPLTYMINMEAIKYIKMWVEKRNYTHEYIFTTKHSGQVKQMSNSWADRFCKNVLSPMLGRRINPHIFKASCISFLLESGVDIALVSKYIAQHEDVATTAKFYDLRDFEEEKNKIFDMV